MAGLYTSIAEKPAPPRRRDEDEGAMLPTDLSDDHPLARSASDGARMEAPSRWVTDEPDASARKPTFDDSASYRVAQAGPVVASDADRMVDSDAAVQLAAAGDPTRDGDPTKDWTPQAVVDKAVEKLRAAGIPVDPAFADRLIRVLKVEQGFADSPDPKDVTNRGVTQKTLDLLNAQKKIKNLPTSVLSLKPEDYYAIYHDEFFAGKKVDRLAAIAGLEQVEPRFLDQVFDVVVNHPAGVGQELLQRSLNEVGPALSPESVGAALKVDGLRNGKHYSDDQIRKMLNDGLIQDAEGRWTLRMDGDLGPATRAVVDLALQAGKIGEVNDRLLQHRLRHIDEESKPSDRRGLKNRALNITGKMNR